MATAYMLRAQGLGYVKDDEGKPLVWTHRPSKGEVATHMERELFEHGLDGGDGTAEQDRWIRVVEVDLVDEPPAEGEHAPDVSTAKFNGKREPKRMGGSAEASDGQRMVVGGVGWVQNPGDPEPETLTSSDVGTVPAEVLATK